MFLGKYSGKKNIQRPAKTKSAECINQVIVNCSLIFHNIWVYI